MKNSSPALHDIKVHVKIKISLLWASVMFCYIYGDYFGLYKPGALQANDPTRTPRVHCEFTRLKRSKHLIDRPKD
jgi:hypothetical protein